jgi:hypothetical protein
VCRRENGGILSASKNPLFKNLLAALTGVVVAGLMTAVSPLAHAADAPPHNISAANLSVVQNDSGNTADSVTVDATLSINDMRVRPGSNRGDYNLQVGDTVTNDIDEGLLMVTIAENGRDNGELADEQKNYAAPAFDGNDNGLWAVIQDQLFRGVFSLHGLVVRLGPQFHPRQRRNQRLFFSFAGHGAGRQLGDDRLQS